MLFELNWLAIVVGTIGYQVLGALWYGQLFDAIWLDEMGYADHGDADTDATLTAYAITTVGALIAVVALAIIVTLVGATTWEFGVAIGLLIGIGFVATTALQAVPFEGRSWTIYAINAGYNIVALAGIGVLLTMW